MDSPHPTSYFFFCVDLLTQCPASINPNIRVSKSFSTLYTHLKFNIAPEKLSSEKESSLPTTIVGGYVVFLGCIQIILNLVYILFFLNFDRIK